MEDRKIPVGTLALGLVSIFLGVIVELVSNPIQPISYVPGLIFLPVTLGLGLALLERWQKLVTLIAYYLFLVGLLLAVGNAETSILPICLLIGSYALGRFALFFKEDEPPSKRRPVRRY